MTVVLRQLLATFAMAAISARVALFVLLLAPSMAIESYHVASTFHPAGVVRRCAFATPHASSKRRLKLSSTTWRTKLAAGSGGGMDAYDEQMAAIMTTRVGGERDRQDTTTTTNEGARELSIQQPMVATSDIESRWSGQNTYTQQLLQSPPAMNDDNWCDNGADAYAAQMDAASRKSFSEEQLQKQSSNNHNTADDDDDDDPYEMQFTHYLQALQAEMEYATATAASAPAEGETSTCASGEPSIEGGLSREELFLDMVSNNVPYKQSAAESSPTSPPPTMEDTTLSAAQQPTQKELEDQFLHMVSNEVQYKKLLGQSPYSVTDIEFPVLVQRFLDNLEDGTQKNNGKFRGESKMRFKKGPKEERKTVVVLGTGWAAHAFVKLASTYDLRVVVVSPVNHFVFTPMLASAAVGTVEYRSMTEPIRVTNPNIDNFVEGRAIGVDVEAKKLQVLLTSLSTVTGAFKGVASDAPCRLDPEPVLTQVVYSDDDGIVLRDKSQGAGGVIEISYDHLICAVGTASRSSMVPGAKEYCFNLKTAQDSKRLRTAIGEALEMASRPDVQEFYYEDEGTKMQAREERRRRVRIAVVGGGPTGVELSGELCDFFAQVCSSPGGAYQHLRDDVSVTLMHGGSELLPAMDKELRARALKALEAQGVDVRLNTRLKEVGLDYIRLGEKGSDIVETIPLSITVWAAGNAPVPFVRELLSQLPESATGSGGRINVDRWLRCPTPSEDSFGSILVLGDVACFESQYKYDTTPEPLPQTAQVAGQQGAFVARMLNRGYDTQHTPPKLPELSADEAFSLLRVWLLSRNLGEAPGFNFLSLGLLAYVGQEEALNQVMVGNVPLFNYSGKIAFALWRSVYLAKQASSRNQALIAFDWLRTEAFGRDITRL